MADYQLQSSKLHVEAPFTGVGILKSDGHKLYGESYLVLKVENVKDGNLILVEGQLAGEIEWDIVEAIRGRDGNKKIDISKFDRVRFNVQRYEKEVGSTRSAKLIATGFYGDIRDAKQPNELQLVQNEILTDISGNIYNILKELKKLNIHLQVITEEKLSDEDLL